MRHYLVVSDLHLCDVEEHEDGWKAYKQRRFHADDQLAEVLAQFATHGAPEDQRVLTLNGDIFDFDLVTATPENAPWPISRRERRRGLRPTAKPSQWKLERILADHPLFLESLVRFAAAGENNSIVYVLGNHDAEFHFSPVERAFRDALQHRAEMLALAEQYHDSRLSFEPWFFYRAGEIYIEHGQQYDYYTSFRYVLHPQVRPLETRPPFLALPMGNLSNRYLMTQMGFFNPHASDYILNVFRYIAHWLRHYAFSWRRHIALPWFFGSLAVITRLFFAKGCLKKAPPDHQRLLERHAESKGVPLEKLKQLDGLKQLPITHRFFRILREFWIDRLALALLMTGGTITLALVPIPLWIKLMVPLTGFPTVFFIYEWAARGDTIFHIEGTLPKMARKVACIFDTKLVIFGHTHKPAIEPIAEGVSYVNTGTWAPVWESFDQDVLAGGYRNVLNASFDNEGKLVCVNLESRLPLPEEGRRIATDPNLPPG